MTIKRWTALLLAALLALSLTACQNEKRIEGLVVEVQTGASGDVTAFVVKSEGNQTGILIAEKATVWPMGISSGSSEKYWAQFQKELQVDALVSSWCYPRREKLETAEGQTVWAYWATSVDILGGLERNALTLRDGTAVDLLEQDDRRIRTYRLPGGTELLRVEDPFGPENCYVGGIENFDDLSEAAQERVRAWYEEQGPLYDEREELEKSYTAYQELGEEFEGDWVRQDTAPCASNERIMYFVTSLTLPQERGERTVYDWQSGGAFDRETGEKLSNWDLFAVSEAEVRRRFPELCGWVDEPELRKAMSGTLEAEMFVFFPEHVSVSFPPGSLPGEEDGYVISVDYKDAPEGFFQPWAIPVSRNE